MTTCTTTRRITIELSLGNTNLYGDETLYTSSVQKTADLQQVFSSHNYSPIIWDKNYRLGANFLYATGFCVDNDSGITIEQAIAKLDQLKINYTLITTRSHREDLHRFRIFIPFNRRVHSYSDYNRIADLIVANHFPSSDTKVLDGARQLYASPPGAFYRSKWTLTDYDVDADIEPVDGSVRINEAWTDKLIVKEKSGKQVLACSLTEKTVIHCPFHADSSTSAFLEFSEKSDNVFIRCSACGKTYWKERVMLPVAELCDRFYSYSTDIFEVGLTGEEFHMSKIGQKKFWVFTGAKDEKTRAEHFDYLVKEKHIAHLKRIDHEGAIEEDQSFFKYSAHDGIFTVHYAPLPVRMKDNGFIEVWLESLFGKHKDFIKQWLAGYSYTNYQKLPTLILKGDRGTGKNTFADAVLSIYPSISQYWHGEDKNFTPEVQKKLLIADESVSANEKQYRMLKQRSGQKMAVVNQKFLPEYQVRNNMNIIILSNEHTPIFVQKDEEPTSEKNNQFFVYSMPQFKGEIDPDYGDKVEVRLGHYIRTELKTVYEAVKNITGCRYSIPTPITDEERALFNVNMTGLEAEAMKFMVKMVERGDSAYTKFFDKGLFPTSFIDEYNISKGYTKNGVIRNLKEKGYLEPKDAVRKMVDDKRQYCFEMTDKLRKWYQEQQKAE